MSSRLPSLSDFGERRLVRELLASRYGPNNPGFGDDSSQAWVSNGSRVVVSTDPAPEPVAWELGDRDFYHWGWLLSTINLSDLAASGALPLGLLTSLTLPSATTIDDFNRLLDGVDDCCRYHGTAVIGGNVREGSEVRCEGTAVGLVEEGEPLSRRGAEPGDVIVVLGQSGLFWSAVMVSLHNVPVDGAIEASLRNALVRPLARVALGVKLQSAGLVHSCTDASDGIYAAICALTSERGLGVVIDPSAIEYLPEVISVAEKLSVDPFRLLLGFGDFQLVVSLPSEHLDQVREIATADDAHLIEVGEVTSMRGVYYSHDGRWAEMNNFDNERFTDGSQFTAGLAAYSNRIMLSPLTTPNRES